MRQRITANIQRDLPLLGLTAGAFLETQARIDTKAGQLAVFDGHCHPGGAFQRVSVGVLGLQRQLDDYLFAIQGHIAALTAAAGALMIQWLQLLHFQRHLEALPVLLRLRRQAQHQGAVSQTPFDGALGVDREAQRFTAGAEFIAQLGQQIIQLRGIKAEALRQQAIAATANLKLAHALGRVFVGGQVRLTDTDRALLAALGVGTVLDLQQNLSGIAVTVFIGHPNVQRQLQNIIQALIQRPGYHGLILTVCVYGYRQQKLALTIQQAQLIAFHHHMGCQAIAGYPIKAGLLRLKHQCGYLVTAYIDLNLSLECHVGILALIYLEAGITTKAGQLAVFDGYSHPGGAFQRVSVGVLGLQRQLDDYLFAIQGHIAALTAAAGALMIQWLQLLHFQRHLEALPVLLRLRRQTQHQGAVGQTPFDGALGVDREAQRFTAGAEFIAQLGQ
ncbi:hypothetical protein TUM17383_24340 [Shewanella algae]|nr:hypothetical protein TUM17383_24340 [Shewanella algae]